MPMPNIGKRNHGCSIPVATLIPKQPARDRSPAGELAPDLLNDLRLAGVGYRQIVWPPSVAGAELLRCSRARSARTPHESGEWAPD